MGNDFDLGANVHRLIAAPTGAGKSYFVGYLVEQLYQAQKPFIILDTKSRNHLGLITLAGLKRLQIRNGAKYDFQRLVKIPYLLCVPSLRTTTEELVRQYTDLLDTVFSTGNNRVVIVEEAHNYNKGNFCPSPVLELVAREGRGRGICLWYLTQRIQDFPKLLWSQCCYTYLLKFNIPQDIRYIEALIPNFGQINRDLGRFDVLEYNHITNEYRTLEKETIQRKTKHYG